jgi:mannitol operon repressor
VHPEDLEYFSGFLKEFQGETDRGAALVGAALLDKQLFNLLKSHFLDKKESLELIDGGTAPLGTFSARIKACYCLGLITDSEHSEIQLVRKVRNEFAHQTHGLTFENEKVKSLCGNLRNRMPDSEEKTVEASLRTKFIHAVIFISLALWYRPQHASKLKAIQRQWPY